MKKQTTISLERAKNMIRRGQCYRVMNQSGWCVVADFGGQSFYVVDDTTHHPVPFHFLQALVPSTSYPMKRTMIRQK